MKANKPKWLRRLERESWQAELIISGAAILGSVQLPSLITRAERYALLNFTDGTLDRLLLVNTYFKLVAFGLIATFLVHFILRALWIGMVGLNSVFPGGFKVAKRFSEDFQEKLRAEYGDIDAYIQRLDLVSSGIFGVGFAATFIFINIGLLGLGAIILMALFETVNDTAASWVGYVILAFIALLSLSSTAGLVLHAPRFRDKTWAKRTHFPLTKLQYRIFYPINTRYLVTSLNLVSTNSADRKGYWGYLVTFGLLLGIVGGTISFSSENIPFFKAEYYHRHAADSTRIYPGAYADRPFEGLLFRPVLPSYELRNTDYLSVWVPLPDRELAVLRENCTVPEIDQTLEGQEKRIATWDRFIECTGAYLSVAINDVPVPIGNLRREAMTNKSGTQFGVRLLLENPPFREGPNLLTVRKAYTNEAGEERIAYVPFFQRGKR